MKVRFDLTGAAAGTWDLAITQPGCTPDLVIIGGFSINPREITFSGYQWIVKSSAGTTVGPGPNVFSNSTDNVWVDAQGRLHVKITNRNGVWNCAEVIEKQTLGLGTYRFYIDSDVCNLDPNVVLGLFTWSDGAAYNHREIDIEDSRWAIAGDSNNAQYVVQPDTPENKHRFLVPCGPIVQSFTWASGSVFFQSKTGSGSVIDEWPYPGAVPPSLDETPLINLWLFNGQAPTNNSEVEIVVSKFEFNGTPSNVSVTPSPVTSAVGAEQSFAATYSDTGGYQNLTWAQLWVMINGSLTEGLSALYRTADKTLWLYDPNTSTWQGGYAAGSWNSITVANGVLNCSKTTVSGSGNNLTVNFDLTPSAGMGGKTFTLNLWCADAGGAQTGYDGLGTWTVNHAPSNVSVTPSSTSSAVGAEQSFAATYSDTGGYQNLTWAQLWVTINGSLTEGLSALYRTADKTLWLYDPNTSTWQGGYAAGSWNSITVANGVLNCSKTTVSGSGNNLTVNFDLTPSAGMGGKTFTLNLWCADAGGAQTGYDGLGTWMVNHAPSNVSVTPSSVTSLVGAEQSFAATYSDTGGYRNLTYTQLWVTINGSLTEGLNAVYEAAGNKLWLYDPDTSTWKGGYAAGSWNSITVANGVLNCSKTTVSGSGNNLTVNFSLLPSAGMGGKTFAMKLWCMDTSGVMTGYDRLGTWTVNHAPSNVSVTLSSVTSLVGAEQSFVATYSDTGGYRNLTWAQLWVTVNDSLAEGLNAVYQAAGNKLWLYDPDTSTWKGGYAAGSWNSITVANGVLNCSKTTVSGSGNNLTVNFDLTPSAGMGGKTFAMKLWCMDASGVMTGYDSLGTWTVNASPSLTNVSSSWMNSDDADGEEAKCVWTLMEAVDAYVPPPVREVDKPFLMSVEDVFTISGRGTVPTGRVERGVLNRAEEVEIVGLHPEARKSGVTDSDMFRKSLDRAEAGDNVGLLLRGVERDDVERGQVIAEPGSIKPHTKFDAEVYVLSKEEGGRHTPFFNGYRPQFYFRTTDVTGNVTLPEEVKKVLWPSRHEVAAYSWGLSESSWRLPL